MSSLGIFNKETKTYQKVAGTAEAAVVDAEMSDTSENPVQNKVVKKYVDDGVEKLKKSVSDGKTKVANAITDKGVETATDATFDVMAENISKIETGGGELHGATISVTTTESTLIGKTIKLSLNSTTVDTKTFDDNGACSFTDIQEAGTYSLYSTDGTDSATIPVDVTAENVVNKTVISCEFYLTPDGETITPVDDVAILLKCAEIKDKSYTTMDELLADEQAMGDITMSENAMKYLARSTGFADAVCANETFMTLLGQSAYVDATVLNSDLWVNSISSSSYWDLIYPSVTVHSSASATITVAGKTFTSDASGNTQHSMPWGTFSISDSVSEQGFECTIGRDTTDVYVMPEGALYWYGNNMGNLECIYAYNASHSYSFDTNSINLSNCTYGIDFRTHDKINVNKYNSLKVTVNKRMDYYGGNIGLMLDTTSMTQYPSSDKDETKIKKYLGTWGYSENASSRGLFTFTLDITDIDGEYYAQWNSYGSGNALGQDLCAMWFE